MIVKKIFGYGVLCFLLLCNNITINADQDFLDMENEPVSINTPYELSIEDIDQTILEAAVQNPGTTRQQEAKTVLDILFNEVHINAVLKNDLYYYTYPLGTRNILTYPSLFGFTPAKPHFAFNFFYQQTTNMFPWCNNIEGYMALFNPTLMQDIDLEIAREKNIDIPKTIGLFKNARVEQRRVGFLFDIWAKFSWFNIGFELPFYAVARNYNLPLEDIQNIESADVFEQSDDNKVEKSAIYPYVLETRIGLGDARVSLGFDVINKDRYRVVLGTKLTFPSAVTFASGFIGSDFKKIVQRCYLDLESTVNAFISSTSTEADKLQAKDNIVNFGVKTVNQMGAILLATQLGDQRFQFALYLEPTIRINDKVTLLGSFRANWMIPQTTSRFIMEAVDQSLFADANFDTSLFPPDQCEQMSYEALCFLSNRLRNMFFPCGYRVKLKTQREFQATMGASFQFTDNWNFLLGYDYWHKQQEFPRGVTQNGASVNVGCIQLCKALVPRLSQQKIFTKIEYAKFKESHNFVFTFGADLPLLSNGIGDDYTGFIRFEWIF